MKVMKNTEHNSIEIDFEGVKPSEQVRGLMKAYGFWWYNKGKVWVHSLAVDGEYFERFAEERIRPLMATPAAVAPTVAAVTAAAASMSEADRQAVLAALMK